MGRTNSTVRGYRSERLAAAYLERRGYRISRFNYRTRWGEIDVIAWDGDVLCFVEVRSRRSATFGHPLETVDWRKRSRLIGVARHYLARLTGPEPAVRFDVVSLVYQPSLEIQLVRNAFEET